MKILFLIKSAGVEKTTAFIEIIKSLAEKGTDIHIVVAEGPEDYELEPYYCGKSTVMLEILHTHGQKMTLLDGLKQQIRKHTLLEKVSWAIFNFFIQESFWIKQKITKHDHDKLVYEQFLNASMRSFKPRTYYDYIWTIDEYGLLWAAWINAKAEIKYKVVHHSYELYWEFYSKKLPRRWQNIKQYALYDKAGEKLKETAVKIIQDELRWKSLCRHVGLDEKSDKVLFPLSIKDYKVTALDDIYVKLDIGSQKRKIIFYPTHIMPDRECIKLANISKTLPEDFITVIHGFAAERDYLEKVEKMVGAIPNVYVSNQSLDYTEMLAIHRDVWCVFLYYGEKSDNDRLIVNSSNKLVMALQAGKPIITLGNKSLATLCTEYKCGIAMDTWSETELVDAICKMESNYAEYCDNARRCYEKRFDIALYAEKMYDALLENIEN